MQEEEEFLTEIEFLHFEEGALTNHQGVVLNKASASCLAEMLIINCDKN